jgi:hypothetical protein
VLTQAKAIKPSSTRKPFVYRSLQKKRSIMKTNERAVTATRHLINSLALFSPVGGGGAGAGESAMSDRESKTTKMMRVKSTARVRTSRCRQTQMSLSLLCNTHATAVGRRLEEAKPATPGPLEMVYEFAATQSVGAGVYMKRSAIG